MQCFNIEQEIPKSNYEHQMLKGNNIDTGATLMMLIMSIVCLLKTLNRYIWLAESLCSTMFNHICFKFLKKFMWSWFILRNIGYLLACFRWYQLFPGLSQVVLDGFRSFQVVSRFSKYVDVLIKKQCRSAGTYPGNSVGIGELGK